MISSPIGHAIKGALVAAAMLAPSTALADTCKVQNSSPPGLWKFVRAYDADTGKEVLRRTINGGDSVEVTVTGSRIRVEYKLAGHRHYLPGVVATCKDGNTLRT